MRRFFLFILFIPKILFAEESESVGYTVEVVEPRVALIEPIGTYSTPASVLRFEPQVDLQARNLAEAQGDVSVRGGIFENTGFRVGANSLFDPQTGHYFAELPIAPQMLSYPEVLTGVENGFLGFNSSVATIDYSWMPIVTRQEALVGFGERELNMQQAYFGEAGILSSDIGSLNLDLEASRSESAGTRTNGDHDFNRFSGRLQWQGTNSQTDLFAGYQSKDFRWPYLYAVKELHELVGSSGIESESLDTSLFLLNHKHHLEGGSFLEVGGYYRRNKDDYEFDTFNPGLFNDFRHKTEVLSTGFEGLQVLPFFDVRYSGTYLADEIESTALTFGEFSSRSYYKLSVLPEKELGFGNARALKLSAGLALDDSNRDSSQLSPVSRIQYNHGLENSDLVFIYAEYARSSQLPGYTAIASDSEAGLFRGNQELAREEAHNIEMGVGYDANSWEADVAVFYRMDDDLVDWTFESGGSSFAARSANNVDIDTVGVETILRGDFHFVDFVFGHTYLNKDDDFGDVDVDASFYALNYARHRFTTALIWHFLERFRLRMDNEYRRQVDNTLRSGDDEPLFTSLSLSWSPPGVTGLELSLLVDNIWNENYEEVPGVPGARRQVAVQAFWRFG